MVTGTNKDSDIPTPGTARKFKCPTPGPKRSIKIPPYAPPPPRRLDIDRCITWPRQLSMAATALVIWLCACVSYWPGLVLECVTCSYCCYISIGWPDFIGKCCFPPVGRKYRSQVTIKNTCEFAVSSYLVVSIYLVFF